jgi:Protein of unknown function (DUF3800)
VSNPEREYIIFCDESERYGKYFSNFYGGVRVAASQLTRLSTRLTGFKAKLGLNSEIKWQKTDPTNVERYARIVEMFFDEIRTGHIAMRVMFTQNSVQPRGLTTEQSSQAYYLLYYQFLKHGFGLRYMPRHDLPPRLRIYLDEIGDTKEQIAKFRGFIAGLAKDSYIRRTGLTIEEQDITEVRSHDHVLLQCLDVVLGAMPFRLNDKHLAKLPGTSRRGNRTRAKEQLYREIFSQICQTTERRFNIGNTTGVGGDPGRRWNAGYLHWVFRPRESQYDPAKAKP